MSLPLDFLVSLSAATLEESMAKNKQNEKRALLEIRNEVTPLDLFCYLGARFGQPNGMQNFLRGDHSDNLVHWDWTLKYRETLIFLWGTNFRTDLFIVGDLPFTEVEKDELVLQIRADMKNFGREMSMVRKNLEHWTEFVNPYWRLTRAITSLKLELSQLNLVSAFSDTFNTPITASEQFKQWEEVSKTYSKAFGLCFGLRSMLPVQAEAFVNLLIFVLARPDIRADTRLLESIFRQQIDIRVKSLHINCLGFEKAVDYSSPACKRFHTLINERNDLLHGNVVPEKQKFNEVYFLGNVPVFTEYRSMWDRTIGVDSKAVGLERLEAETVTVTEFVEFVLSCLKPKAGEFMRNITKKRDLAKNHEDDRIGMLFPDQLIDSRPVFDSKKRGAEENLIQEETNGQ